MVAISWSSDSPLSPSKRPPELLRPARDQHDLNLDPSPLRARARARGEWIVLREIVGPLNTVGVCVVVVRFVAVIHSVVVGIGIVRICSVFDLITVVHAVIVRIGVGWIRA